jgi:hypothetical protein
MPLAPSPFRAVISEVLRRLPSTFRILIPKGLLSSTTLHILLNPQSALKDNGDVENAAGMTQEMHNCEDAGGDFPFPDEDDEDSRKQLSPFERMRPVLKEIESVFEGASEEQVDKALAMLHLVVAQGQAFRAENQPKTNGTVVSCLPKNKAANKKHKKQLLRKQR